MIPILAYKYYKNKRTENRRKMEEGLSGITQNLPRSLIPDKILLNIPEVCATLADEDAEDLWIPGVLSSMGIFIQWAPVDDSPDTSTWEFAGDGENLTLQPSSTHATHENLNCLKFCFDIHDLKCFKHIEGKNGRRPCIRFINVDGSNYVPLYFKAPNSTEDLFSTIRGFVTLRRSAKEKDLVLVLDEKKDALSQSIVALDNNDGILNRFVNDPYATAMTLSGKITGFVQDQLYASVQFFPALLDADAVNAEERIRAMRDLQNSDDQCDGTAGQFRIYRESDQGEFEMIQSLVLPDRPEIARESAVTETLWESFKNADGVFDTHSIQHIKMTIFRSGLSPNLRKEVWKYLLEYRLWTESEQSFAARRIALAEEYYRMKEQWKSISPDQESRFSVFARHKGLIEKDVNRTDRTFKYFRGDDNANLVRLNDVLMTYCMYNFDLGYVQGMSDFASPVLFVMEDEVDAFWCFVQVMKIVHANFSEDQGSIKLQLCQLRDLVLVVNPNLSNYLEAHQSDDMYFCFRWVLVWFKREFSFEDTSKLWEILWTRQPCKNFHLLISVAILDKQMNTIIENGFGLTEILKHVNDLSMHIPLEDVLKSAEAIFHQLAATQDKLPKYVCDILGFGEQNSSER